jgi:hypothetical protein
MPWNVTGKLTRPARTMMVLWKTIHVLQGPGSQPGHHGRKLYGFWVVHPCPGPGRKRPKGRIMRFLPTHEADKLRRVCLDSLMKGFPPESNSLVTLDNWQTPPFNRWAFQHKREIVLVRVGR